LKKRALFILLALALLVGGMDLFTRGEYFSGKIRTYVLDQAKQELGLDVGMDRLVFNFFPAYIDLKRPYVKGWDPKNPGRSIGAEKIRAYVSLSALLNKRIYIRRVQVYGISLDVARLPDGHLDIDPLRDRINALLKKKPKPGAYKVEVKEIVLFDARGTYSDAANRIFLSVGDAGVDFRMDGERYWTGFKFTNVAARVDGRPPVHASLEGDGEYAGGRINLQGVRLKAEGASLVLSGHVTASRTPELDIKFSSLADLRLMGKLGLMNAPPSGLVKLSGRLNGKYPSITGKGEFSLKKGAYQGVRIDDLYSKVLLDKGKLTVSDLESRLFGGKVRGDVLVDFSGAKPSFTSKWVVKGLSSGSYTASNPKLKFIPWYTVDGDVNISGAGFTSSGITASGTVSAVRYEKAHDVKGVSAELSTVRQAKADFRIGGGVVRVDRGFVYSKNTTVSFAGVVGFDGTSDMAIKARSEDVTDISALIGYSDVHGKLDLSAYMRGNIVEPTITGKAKISDAVAHGISFPAANGDVKLSGWQLSFSDFMVHHKSGNFVLDGTIFFKGNGGTFDNPYFKATLSVRKVDVRGIVAIFYKDIPINMSAEGDLNFSGTTKTFKGVAKLVTGAGDVYGQPIDEGQVTAVLSENEIRFPKVVAVRGNDVVTGSGVIGFDNTFHGKASSARFNLGNLKLLADTGAPIKGSASFSVTGQGTFDKPLIKATMSTFKLSFKDVDLGAGRLDAELWNGSLKLDGTVLDKKVGITGSLGMSAPYKWNASMVFNGGRLEPFLRLAYKDLPEDVTIVSTGVFTGSGELSNPSDTSVAADFKKVNAIVMGRKLENDGDIRVSYRDGKLDLESFRLRGDELTLEASGVATGIDRVDAAVKARADLDVLKPFLKGDVDYISGRGQADLRVRGGLMNPEITGTVRVTDGGIKIKDFPQRFDKVNAEARVEGASFRITKFKAEFGGGKLSATGSGSFKGWQFDSFGFDISADGIRVNTIEGLNPTVDASIRFEGVGDRMNASGDVTVRKARYAQRIDWKSWLVQIQKRRNLPAPEKPGGLKDISLDIHVTAAETIRIDNNLAKVPVSADVYVRGTASQPVLIGRLEASSGSIYFRNNEFKLQNAVLEFANPKKFNPLIDLTAETKVQDYTITLVLTGTFDRIKVNLTSDPPLEESDVVTLLTVGRTSEGLKGHEAAITTGEAAGFVTGQIQDAVESRVKMITGFDRFQIDPYMTSTGVSSGPRLTVGKSLLSEKLYLTYSSNVGTSEDQYIKLEYMFNRNVSLVGERDELGHYGADLQYRFEFR
jgi:autotransporter translocation and assembly factor TamB